MLRIAARITVVALVVMGSAALVTAGTPKWAGSWQNGPVTTFPTSFSRFDGAFYEPSGLVYFLGGRNGTNTDGSIWSFNPVAGTYADTGVDMPIPISNYTVNVLTDATGTGFYTFCGRTAAAGQTFGVQVYYPATNTATQLAGDDFPGDATHTCTSALNVVVNNKVYLAGGFDATNNNDQTWVFDPMAPPGSRWTQLVSANLAQGRAYIMGAAVDGLVYAIGGAYWDGAVLQNVATVAVLDPAAGTPSWNDAAVADLPEVCSSSRAWGFDTGSLYEDPTDNTPLGGKIISGCGVWSTPITSVYAYTVATSTWAAFPSLIGARRDTAGEFLPLASAPALWLWGGYDAGGVETNTVEYYSLALVPVELQSFSVE